MVSLGLLSHLPLLWCFVSAAVTHVHSLPEIALDYIRIEQTCCICQVELVMMSQSVMVRIAPLVDHIFLLMLVHFLDRLDLRYTSPRMH